MRERVSGASTRFFGRDHAERRVRVAWAVCVTVVFATLVYFGEFREASIDIETVVIYCFSALEEPLRDAVLPAFQVLHERETGRRVEFVTVFAGSGAITQQIVREVPAHVAVLSSSVDAHSVSLGGLRARETPLPHGGTLTRTPLVLVVREGNPLGIHDWQDLARRDVAIVHPDPVSSGAGVWSILAQYGSIEKAEGALAARDHLATMRDRVVLWPASASLARQAFLDGAGDVLITYAHEAHGGSRRAGIAGDIVYPQATILTEHVVTRVRRSDLSRHQEGAVDALLAFLWSDEAQRLFTEYGLQRASATTAGVPPGVEVITLEALGGAPAVQRRILQDVWYGELAAPSIR